VSAWAATSGTAAAYRKALEAPHIDKIPIETRQEWTRLSTVPEPPQGLEHLWQWWLELDAGRQSTGFGMGRITWLDLYAWSSLNGLSLSPLETRLLMAMDRAYLAAKNTPPPKPGTPGAMPRNNLNTSNKGRPN
jgi:hypothetical protein